MAILKNFFDTKIKLHPPSLTKQGTIRSGEKSKLIRCLEAECPPLYEKPDLDVIILEGSVLINLLKPGLSLTFDDYACNVFIPYIQQQLRSYRQGRHSLVFENSLKSVTRNKFNSIQFNIFI